MLFVLQQIRVSKLPMNFAQSLIVSFIVRHIHAPSMTSKTCGFLGFARHFQFNLFWLLDLIIDVLFSQDEGGLFLFSQDEGSSLFSQDEGGHPNLAVGAGGPSYLSLRPSSATGEPRHNRFYNKCPIYY